MTKCIETNIRRLPVFKKNLEELRQRDYNNKGDEIALKQTLSDLNTLIGESPEYWSIELAIWAINTIAGLGKLLGSHYPKTSLIETTQFWMDQEVTSKLSHIIVSGILYGLDNNKTKIMEILVQQAYDCSPYLDWILACISISKPKVSHLLLTIVANHLVFKSLISGYFDKNVGNWFFDICETKRRQKRTFNFRQSSYLYSGIFSREKTGTCRILSFWYFGRQRQNTFSKIFIYSRTFKILTFFQKSWTHL